MPSTQTRVSNHDFLKTVFGDPRDWDDETRGSLFTASFPGDPAKGARWGFNPIVPASENTYWCVSRHRRDAKGARNRKLETWVSLVALSIDDVGTKVPAPTVIRQLGDPNCILETSPGSYQYTYFLREPCTDRALAEGLVQAACRFFGLDDMAGLNRLVRLPEGTNGKPQHAQAGWDGGPWQHSLLLWAPSPRHDPEALLKALGGTRVEVAPEAAPEALPLDLDPVYLALEALGLILGAANAAGWIPILCPWIAEHTDGDTTGTAYKSPHAFACHHGHCRVRTFRDLREVLGIEAEDVDAAKALAWAEELVDQGQAPGAEALGAPQPTAAEELEERISGGEQAGQTREEALRAALSQYGLLLGKALRPSTRVDYVIRGLFHEGETVMISGDSGTLKTMVCIAMGLQIARGEAFWGRDVRAGGALLVAAEGGRGLRARVCAQRQALGIAPELELPYAVLPRPVNLFDTSVEGRDAFASFLRAGRAFEELYQCALRHLTFDTYHQNSAGAEENSARDFGIVYSRLREVVKQFPQAVVVLAHHNRKTGDEYRGSGAMRNDLDVLLATSVLSDLLDAPPTALMIERRAYELRTTKAKDGPDDLILGYRSGLADVGTDDEGHEILAPYVVHLEEGQRQSLTEAARQWERGLDEHAWILNLITRLAGRQADRGKGGWVEATELRGAAKKDASMATLSARRRDARVSASLDWLEVEGLVEIEWGTRGNRAVRLRVRAVPEAERDGGLD